MNNETFSKHTQVFQNETERAKSLQVSVYHIPDIGSADFKKPE